MQVLPSTLARVHAPCQTLAHYLEQIQEHATDCTICSNAKKHRWQGTIFREEKKIATAVLIASTRLHRHFFQNGRKE